MLSVRMHCSHCSAMQCKSCATTQTCTEAMGLMEHHREPLPLEKTGGLNVSFASFTSVSTSVSFECRFQHDGRAHPGPSALRLQSHRVGLGEIRARERTLVDPLK